MIFYDKRAEYIISLVGRPSNLGQCYLELTTSVYLKDNNNDVMYHIINDTLHYRFNPTFVRAFTKLIAHSVKPGLIVYFLQGEIIYFFLSGIKLFYDNFLLVRFNQTFYIAQKIWLNRRRNVYL